MVSRQQKLKNTKVSGGHYIALYVVIALFLNRCKFSFFIVEAELKSDNGVYRLSEN